ncbi:MFS transporter [Solihabitans fulvus]|uniref:MFS transporter n=1 Tax=Solihabitans fulvus TaxID=1892852 RepID=A0A5B2XIY4_9PSEU|nr:MFS transporter [Solihabitans fulvus]KAA2262841.1 MFS transporter [Solihabitans fulvus]
MSTTSEPVVTGTSDATGALADAPGPDPRRWLALGVIAVAQLMVVLDASIVNIALPSAQHALNISDADRQWVVTAYTLAFGGLLLLGGRIADYVGRKRIFVIGLIGFALASALGGAAQDATMLFASRALQGAFAALLAPAALSLITVTFTEPRERARAFGVYGAIAGGGAAIGLILGGVLTEYASWRWCLLVNVPIAVLAAFAALRVVKESKASGNTKYDVPGAVLVTAGLVAIVYGFTEAAKPGVGWTAGSTLTLLIVGVLLLAAFVVVEARTENPLLPLRIVLDRNRGGVFLASLLIGAGLFAMFLFLAFYFQANLGYSPLKSGFAFLPFSGGIIVTAGVVSNLLPRTGPKPLMLIGGVLATAGLLYLVTLEQDSSWLVHVLPSELMMSIGMGMIFVPLSSLALHGVSPHDAGVASAMLNTSQQVGGALGTALLNTLYASAVTSYIAANATGPQDIPGLMPFAAIHGYHRAFLVGGIFLGAALIALAIFVTAKKSDVNKPEGASHAMA